MSCGATNSASPPSEPIQVLPDQRQWRRPLTRVAMVLAPNIALQQGRRWAGANQEWAAGSCPDFSPRRDPMAGWRMLEQSHCPATKI